MYKKIKLLGNKQRFKIIELTQDKSISIIELSNKLGLAYNKCSDYITMLDKENLVEKSKQGRETLIKSKVKLGNNIIKF